MCTAACETRSWLDCPVYSTLIVESDRMDAALRVDCGKVPRLLLLSPGKHKVFLQAANAPDKTREVEAKVGYRTSVRINSAGRIHAPAKKGSLGGIQASF